jgi:hypothetical protein
VQAGLNDYTWNSVELSDYIEKAHSLICTDLYQNLELVQTNFAELKKIVTGWTQIDSDVFSTRTSGEMHNAKRIADIQKSKSILFFYFIYSFL